MRRMLVVLMLVVMTVTSGCWSQKNLDQLTVVSAIGLDAAPDNRIVVTIQLVNPVLPGAAGGSSDTKNPYALYSAEASTVYEAFRLIRQKAKKIIFTPQTRTVIIGEPLARRGLDGFSDFFWRDNGQNLASWVIVAEPSAAD